MRWGAGWANLSGRAAAWHIGGSAEQTADMTVRMSKSANQKFGQTANYFYQILSANRRKLRDGKATELRCAFYVFSTFHTMLAGLQLSKPMRNLGTQS